MMVDQPAHERKMTYEVTVTTGSQVFAGTINNIYLTLVGTDRHTEKSLLEKSMFDYFETESKYNISVKRNLGDIVLVKLQKEKHCYNDQWYCRYITVTTPSGNKFDFPCYRWIAGEKEVVLREGRARLPQDDSELLKHFRLSELDSKQEMFRWKEWCPGFPMSIDCKLNELPLEVQFDTGKSMDFNLNVLKAGENLCFNKFMGMFQSWKELGDFEQIFVNIKNTVPECVMKDWNKDAMFGYELLNGCNPVTIRKCKSLPEKFPVTQEMVQGFLEGNLTLQDELEEGNIFITDYEILKEVPGNNTDPSTQQYLAAPICLLYKNCQEEIVPIAIQLGQKPGGGNPIFLPNDDKYDWMLAKMWVKSSDYNVHEVVTHLLRTHLISEVFAIAMYRQLSSVHPVYKLLIPHIRFTIAINASAREALICEGGVSEKANGLNAAAAAKVIQKAMKSLTFKSFCFPDEIKARGMEDVPNYFYRDDGIKVWDAVKNFVSDVVKIYYDSDYAVQNDEEIQGFVKDVCCNGMKNSASCEFPMFLNTQEELVEYLTVVIFTVSAQHAAVNFGLFDWYAWIPNSPSTMRKPPPKQKGQVDMKYIMESLPDRERSCWVLGLLWTLSQFQKNELFLGTYPEKYFTEEPVMKAIYNFQKNLEKITNMIKSRNQKLQLPYWYLSPDRIPNSIAI